VVVVVVIVVIVVVVVVVLVVVVVVVPCGLASLLVCSAPSDKTRWDEETAVGPPQ